MQRINPTSIRPPFANYVHGVLVPPGQRLLVASGQLGVDKTDICPPTAEAQAAQCFANIDAILAEAGMAPEHVVRINAYVSDRAHMKGYMRARDAWLGARDELPASTLMIVAGFTRPEFFVEVEVLAAAP